MDKYMLFFRSSLPNEADFQNMSPEDMQAEIQKWNQWIGGIALSTTPRPGRRS
jgi:hypothetical protein